MLYSLFEYLNTHFDIPGSGMVQYISFRAVSAIVLALVIGICFGDKVINFLRRKQIGEEIRTLGLEGENAKKGTPTMGGIIILGATLIPILLVGDLSNVYIQLMIVATLWLGLLGFLDDYIKVFRKHKTGLKGRFKVIGQVGLGVIVGSVMCLNQDIVVVEQTDIEQQHRISADSGSGEEVAGATLDMLGKKNTKTTIPFIKNNEADYHNLVPIKGQTGDVLTWVLYILIAIFIITAVSNGANLTDGLDGLSAGVSAIVVVTLGILAYLSGHTIYSDYLNIMYIPLSGELTVYAAALVGALIAFLWFNCFPAQVFMGDTGSLALGGIIAVFALLIRKELLLPLLCGVFLLEVVSVIIQVSYFKYTKNRHGEGRRIFLMSPLHHHYQKKGMPETKIVVRFWIIQVLLAALTLVTLKIR